MLYPVVNAQNLSMVNFPAFADENSEDNGRALWPAGYGNWSEILCGHPWFRLWKRVK